MKKILALLFFLAAAAVVIFIVFYPSIKKQYSRPTVATFQQCVSAGYPVIQSYPPECTLPSGQFFVDPVVNEH